MRRGEVWWSSARLPGGSRKRRPMVVVSHDLFNENPRYSKVLVVHLPSIRRPGGPYDWEVDVTRGTAGLARSGVVKCAEIYTVFKAELVQRIGSLPGATMANIDRALGLALGLPAGPAESW